MRLLRLYLLRLWYNVLIWYWNASRPVIKMALRFADWLDPLAR